MIRDLTGGVPIVRLPWGFTLSGSAAGIGYSTGAGGAVTQITNRSTGVTLNKPTGQITTINTSLAAAAQATFIVTNSLCGINDIPVLAIQSGTNGGNTKVTVTTVTGGTFSITVANDNASGGTAETGAIIINFAIMKGASS